MWEDRRYVMADHRPNGNGHPVPSHTNGPHDRGRSGDHDDHRERNSYHAPAPFGYGNTGYEDTEDLHAWSIYRQNLNADLSESAIGLNRLTTSGGAGGVTSGDKPFGNFHLKESTVNNILHHPKYGPSLKNHDPYTYLRFGLPRVKPTSEIGLRHHPPPVRVRGSAESQPSDEEDDMDDSDGHHGHHHHGHQHQHQQQQHHPRGNGHANGHVHQSRDQQRRVWKSNPDLARNGLSDHHNHHHHHELSKKMTQSHLNVVPSGATRSVISGHQGGRPNGYNNKAISEIDLRRDRSQDRSQPNIMSPNRWMKGAPSVVNMGSTMGSTIGSTMGPHLSVSNLFLEQDCTSFGRRICGAQRQKLRVLDNVTFDVAAGEMVAIMATSDVEGTALLDVLSDRYHKKTCRVKGDFMLNGHPVNPSKLATVTSHVKGDSLLCPNMTSRQTLLFTSLLHKPASRSSSSAESDPKKRSYSLLNDLGLHEVGHSTVGSLTGSERRRLRIATCLQQDGDIILLDNPVKDMDIFDSFFLVDYLRQWALLRNRIVVLTIHPATYDIFCMMSKVVLISTGRVLYFGPRKDMMPYFAYLDYPCPAFKNPSDYYLDLVTLDNLSQEAMMESSQRIHNLVDLFRRRADSHPSAHQPHPPAPYPLPPSPKQSGFFVQFLALWIRALIFRFPYNLIHLFGRLFICLLVSITVGVMYWHVRAGREQEHLWDRIHFYHSIMAIAPLPLMFLIIQDAHNEKQLVLDEVANRWYSSGSYLVSHFLYSIPSVTLCFIALSLPASSMMGLHHDLSLYLLLMLCHLHWTRFLVLCCTWWSNSKGGAAIMFGAIWCWVTLSSGTLIHSRDVSLLLRWFHPINPIRWTHESLLQWEFSSNVTLALSSASAQWVATNLPYLCSHNPIIQQENAILIKADCGLQSRPNIMSWFGYREPSPQEGVMSLITSSLVSNGVIGMVFLFLSLFVFLFLSKMKAPLNKQLHHKKQ